MTTSTARRDPLVQKIEAKRRSLRMSQEKFAVGVLGLSYTTYQRWLHRRFNPSYKTLRQLEKLVKGEAPVALVAGTDPVLADLWNNPKDAAYDRL